jgi:integrase
VRRTTEADEIEARELTKRSGAQLGTFDFTRDDRLHALYVVAVTTGMRLSEIAALRYRNLNLDGAAPELRVGRARVAVGSKVAEGEPKTAAGRRTIPLTAQAVTALRAWRKSQTEEHLALAPAPPRITCSPMPKGGPCTPR